MQKTVITKATALMLAFILTFTNFILLGYLTFKPFQTIIPFRWIIFTIRMHILFCHNLPPCINRFKIIAPIFSNITTNYPVTDNPIIFHSFTIDAIITYPFAHFASSSNCTIWMHCFGQTSEQTSQYWQALQS